MGVFILSCGHSIIYKTNRHKASKLQGILLQKTWIKVPECMQKTCNWVRDYPEENHILGLLYIWAQDQLNPQSCTGRW